MEITEKFAAVLEQLYVVSAILEKFFVIKVKQFQYGSENYMNFIKIFGISRENLQYILRDIMGIYSG